MEPEVQLKDLPGLKHDDLLATTECKICHRPIGQDVVPLFYRIRVERCGWDARAIQRFKGLSDYLCSPVLARVMGPDEDLAKILDSKLVVVHESCADKVHHLLQLLEEP